MPSPNPGLKVQAAQAIAMNTEKNVALAVLLNKSGTDNYVSVPVELLEALQVRLDASNKVIQKQDQKIDKLNEDLFNS